MKAISLGGGRIVTLKHDRPRPGWHVFVEDLTEDEAKALGGKAAIQKALQEPKDEEEESAE